MKKPRPTFGPWSTSLHDELGERLSTFWRRRLSRLPIVAATPRRLNRFVAVALAVVAIGVTAVPMMRLARGAEEDAEQEIADALSVIEAESQRQYVHRFSNGVEVQLIGLSNNPSLGQPWWRPDGSPLDERPYEDVRARMNDTLTREVCFRWKNLPEKDYTILWHTDPHYSGAGGAPFLLEGTRVEGVSASAVSFNQNLDACTFRFSCSVDATPWETSFRNTAGGNYASMGNRFGGAIFGPVFQTENGVSIVVSYQTPDRDVRLIGIDNDGETHVADFRTGAGANGFTQATFVFDGLTQKDLQRFELQTQVRKIETVEFRNVSLHPDRMTDIQIVPIVDDAPAAAPAAAATPADTDEIAEFIEELGLGPYPMRFSMSADPPEDWPEKRQKLYDRVRELSNEAAADPRLQLADGEVLKFIPADTDLPALRDLRRLHAHREGPIWLTMHQVENGLRIPQFTFSDRTVADTLDDVLDLKLHRLDGDPAILTAPLRGDWLFARNPQEPQDVDPQELAAMEQILGEQLELPIHLELKTVDRPVYVARGKFQFHDPMKPDAPADAAATIRLPARRTTTTGTVAQTFDEFLEKIGEVLMTPVVDELDERPTARGYFLMLDGPQAAGLFDPLPAETEEQVIAALAEQTGLTFTLGTRPVEMLFITSRP